MSPLERKAEEARVLQEEEAARRMEEDTQLEEDIPQQQEKRDDELAIMEKDQHSHCNGSAEQEEKLIAEQASHEPAGEEKEQSNSND